MPNIKSAKKRVLQNEKRRLRNKSYKSALKTKVKKFLTVVEKGDIEEAKKLWPETASMLDRMGQKRIFHPNSINRRKSHLHKKYNALLATEKEQKDEE